MAAFVGYCVAAYLLGSLPFGYLMGRLKGVDIRTAGSRNIGATNCWRVCGWKCGFAAFVLDVGKGFVPTYVAWLMTRLCPLYNADVLGEAARHVFVVVAGASAIAGHVLPVYLRFRGGKAVATSLGVLLGIPAVMPLAVAAFAAWLIVFALTRYVSVASTIAALTLLAGALTVDAANLRIDLAGPWHGRLPLTIMIILLVVLVLVRHRSNYRRLLAGTENKFSGKKN
ncbi:MAG: glycerol-3-phosphate 1-O-acyltransferase PlsY [Planctomycetes bacterium]|nr:glycerol-3-phosphate 1-O-acyltransferase PlsY [Planctomycetota bacterium]